MLHVLSLATLFPDSTRPNFGIFVEKSLAALAAQNDVAVTIIAPVGLPPWPLSLHPRYAALRALPCHESWRGLSVFRPRFLLLPKVGARSNPAMIARAVLPIARRLHAAGQADVIDAQFFHPDGPAAAIIAGRLALPFSIKARGSDISLWAVRDDTGPAIRAAAAAADGLLAVSESLKADMVATGMEQAQIVVHYTGLDSEQFRVTDRMAARQAWGLPVDAPVVLTVGALTRRKGQQLVLDAMAHLPTDTHYLLAGAGEEADWLRAHADALGIGDRVRFLGAVPHDRLPTLYAAADVMALPSASEGLANAWVESLACGTPLVLADIPPAREIIDAPDAGRIVPAEPAAIAKAIGDLLAAPPDRTILSSRTQARFDWDRNGAELAAHLRRIAGKW